MSSKHASKKNIPTDLEIVGKNSVLDRKMYQVEIIGTIFIW